MERLTQSRVVVLPYVASSYAMRGSGIAAEAFGYGLPVVAPAQSWISDRLAEGYGAGITFEPLTAESVTSAALSALSQHQQLASSAQRSASRWRDENSAAIALQRLRRALSI
jgi:glycosyltransferase involved in cell wall biosynthesis